ncbi:MAG: flagellar biosynthesis protein FliQ [FCB group bacterium]|nr:flagellar biosynthesis protein FliQ [FCB group bacterium]
MTPDYVLYLSKETLMTSMQILLPILGGGLIVGLAVGIFQAVTQINEMTLTFIPKMAVVGFVILLLMPWFIDVMVSFTQEIFNQIPLMVQ